MTADPLDDFRELLDKLPPARDLPPAPEAGGFDAGGDLARLARWLAQWSAGAVSVARPTIAIFAGAHGLARHGVSFETNADARAFLDAASANTGVMPRICAGSNIGLKVLELALDYPTGDISQGAALDARGCAATMAFGMEAAAGGNDLLCLSSVGAGGDVSARALLAAMAGGTGEDWADAGAPQHFRLRQASIIDSALARRVAGDGLACIADLGGREIAAVAGAIIAARMERIPVVLDGLPALAAAVALNATKAGSIAHCALASSHERDKAASLANAMGLESILGQGPAASPGVASAIAVQTLRLAALAGPA